jgi:hypothetical protein
MIILHRIWVTICVIAGFPFIAFAVLLAVAGIGVACQRGLQAGGIQTIIIMMMLILLYGWCIRLCIVLWRGKVLQRRLELIIFYGVCGIISITGTTLTISQGTTATISNGMRGSMLFPPVVSIAVTLFWIIPIVALWIQRNWIPNNLSDRMQ